MFSLGFKPGDLGGMGNRHQRACHIEVFSIHILQALMFDGNIHPAKVIGYQKAVNYIPQRSLKTRRICKILLREYWEKGFLEFLNAHGKGHTCPMISECQPSFSFSNFLFC